MPDHLLASSNQLFDSINLITLQSEDAEALAELELSCNRPPWSKRMFADEFLNQVSRILGVVYRGQLIGYAVTQLVADEGYLLKLGIAPSYRGQGLGRALLGATLDDLGSRGATNVWLEVREANYVAQNLYNSFGFSSRGVRVAYYSDDGENAVVMAAELANADSVKRPLFGGERVLLRSFSSPVVSTQIRDDQASNVREEGELVVIRTAQRQNRAA